jgi:hypothetical protein
MTLTGPTALRAAISGWSCVSPMARGRAPTRGPGPGPSRPRSPTRRSCTATAVAGASAAGARLTGCGACPRRGRWPSSASGRPANSQPLAARSTPAWSWRPPTERACLAGRLSIGRASPGNQSSRASALNRTQQELGGNRLDPVAAGSRTVAMRRHKDARQLEPPKSGRLVTARRAVVFVVSPPWVH